MTDSIQITIKGLDKLQKNMAKVAADLPKYVQGAQLEISDEILNERGLRSYPPATAANAPPPPFYIRGRGMQTSASRNDMRSERLGTRWQSVPYGRMGMKISNPVSYARFVHGEEQAGHMARKGWKKLFDVAKSKIGAITSIYNKWVDRLIQKHGL